MSTTTLPRKIHFRSEQEERDDLAEALRRQRAVRTRMSMAAQLAGPALERLATVMTQRSGQPYKLRALLYSLWNGQPASLVEIVSLDYAIREDFCLVLAAFGYEGKDGQFFYNAITEALKNVGQFEWFLEEHKSEGGAS